jgi:diguanylate cyclase (GGDEF)-like protein
MPPRSRLSWLCATSADRERVVDMEQRIKPLRGPAFAVLAGALLISGPWVGWWTIIPLVAAGLAFAITDRGLDSSACPEYRMAAAWLSSELAIAASVALTGGPHSPAISWLVLPVVTLAARFNTRGVAAGGAVAALLIVAATVGVHPAYAAHHPETLVFPLALLGGVALLSIALMRSDLQHRTESVIDPLTSMLNRNALQPRIAELQVQAEIVGQPIGLIVGDLDHFKAINDAHGHATGDAVLRDVAYRLRKRLRAFDLAYRLGGEEFLVLLPGADAIQAARVAEDLRAAVADEPSHGREITMSLGVTASPGGNFDYERTFAAADRALYEAKAMGRNRVHVAGSEPTGIHLPTPIPA